MALRLRSSNPTSFGPSALAFNNMKKHTITKRTKSALKKTFKRTLWQLPPDRLEFILDEIIETLDLQSGGEDMPFLWYDFKKKGFHMSFSGGADILSTNYSDDEFIACCFNGDNPEKTINGLKALIIKMEAALVEWENRFK